MTTAEPDYKLLYEQAQQKLEQTEQKLRLALLDANELRRKLFGIRSDNRVKKHLEGQLDLFPLGATFEDIQNSEELTVKETKNLDQEQDNQGEKRLKAGRSRMVLPGDLEREEIIIDPQGDLTDYKVIGQEVTEILVMVPACFRVQRIIRRKWALKDAVNSNAKGVY